jgi:Ca2+-binding EF-hand superfamily protein
MFGWKKDNTPSPPKPPDANLVHIHTPPSHTLPEDTNLVSQHSFNLDGTSPSPLTPQTNGLNENQFNTPPTKPTISSTTPISQSLTTVYGDITPHSIIDSINQYCSSLSGIFNAQSTLDFFTKISNKTLSELFSTEIELGTTQIGLLAASGALLSLFFAKKLVDYHHISTQQRTIQHCQNLIYFNYHSERILIVLLLSNIVSLKTHILETNALMCLHQTFADLVQMPEIGCLSYSVATGGLFSNIFREWRLVPVPWPRGSPQQQQFQSKLNPTNAFQTPQIGINRSKFNKLDSTPVNTFFLPSQITDTTTHKLFTLFDVKNDQQIDFFEFVLTISLLFSSPLYELFSTAYDRFDMTNSNDLSVDQTCDVLEALNPYNHIDIADYLRLSTKSTSPTITRDVFATICTQWCEDWAQDGANIGIILQHQKSQLDFQYAMYKFQQKELDDYQINMNYYEQHYQFYQQQQQQQQQQQLLHKQSQQQQQQQQGADYHTQSSLPTGPPPPPPLPPLPQQYASLDQNFPDDTMLLHNQHLQRLFQTVLQYNSNLSGGKVQQVSNRGSIGGSGMGALNNGQQYNHMGFIETMIVNNGVTGNNIGSDVFNRIGKFHHCIDDNNNNNNQNSFYSFANFWNFEFLNDFASLLGLYYNPYLRTLISPIEYQYGGSGSSSNVNSISGNPSQQTLNTNLNPNINPNNNRNNDQNNNFQTAKNTQNNQNNNTQNNLYNVNNGLHNHNHNHHTQHQQQQLQLQHHNSMNGHNIQPNSFNHVNQGGVYPNNNNINNTMNNAQNNSINNNTNQIPMNRQQYGNNNNNNHQNNPNNQNNQNNPQQTQKLLQQQVVTSSSGFLSQGKLPYPPQQSQHQQQQQQQQQQQNSQLIFPNHLQLQNDDDMNTDQDDGQNSEFSAMGTA